jgi:hypothetical protein
MDKAARRQELLSLIEEDIMVLTDSLGNFSRMSIYDPSKEDFMEHTKRDIDFMLELRVKIKNKLL